LRVDQSLNFFRGVIEAPRQVGDLVAALHFHPRGEVTLSELFDVEPQPLQTSRDSFRHRLGADSNRDSQHHDGQ